MVTSYTYILPSFIAELEGSQLCALSVCSGLVNHSSEESIRMTHPHMHLKNVTSFISVLTDAIKFVTIATC